VNVRELKERLEEFDDHKTVIVPNARGSARELAEVKEVNMPFTEDGDYATNPTKVEGDLRYTAFVVALAPTSKPSKEKK
jgi:hypothetical protein